MGIAVAIDLLGAAVVALGVALINLLIAGYALAAARSDRSRITFALGPAGVGAWALAWFASLFNMSAQESIGTVGGYAAVVAVAGFAADALRELDRRRRRAILAAAGLGLALGSLVGPGLDPVTTGPRALAMALLGVIAICHFERARTAPAAAARFSRQVWRRLLACAIGYTVISGVGVALRREMADSLLLVALAVEVLTLGYIVNRRVEVQLLLSRAVTFVVLSVAVALAAVGAFRLLGYPADIVVITSTLAVALFGTVLFMGFADLMTDAFERMLFPHRARLAQALGASRGELLAIRRRLERVEKLAIVGELAASVAHEIKNPVAPIRGYAQLLSERLAGVDPADRPFFEKALAIISEESDRIDARVAELLRLSRGERAADARREVVDLNRVVLDAIAVAEGEPGSPPILQRLDPTLGATAGNEDEMRGAMLNLLRNAAEAMLGTDGARIEVVTRAEAGGAVVEVLDEGVGITAPECERVFEAFYTTKREGTGLGMAIAQSAVQAAGGRIHIGPRTDRRGAIVRVELALARSGA